MKISELGEFGLIERIAKTAESTLPRGVTGIGDDGAVFPGENETSFVVSTDLLVEDIHFLRSHIPPKALGYKSLAVNLSDLAAMGASPRFALLNFALPKDISVEWCDGFLSGFTELANATKTALIGGDTTGAVEKVTISITVIGVALTEQIKFRSSAKNGDIICVTGALGDSAGGLRAIFENRSDDDCVELIHAHYWPEPQLAEGEFLGRFPEVHAMMDLSDGVASDIRRILLKSDCGAEIDCDAVPISVPLDRACHKYTWEPLGLTLAGGEDYKLMATVAADAFESLAEQFSIRFSRELFPIGKITEERGIVRYLSGGKAIDVPFRGFDHFAGTSE